MTDGHAHNDKASKLQSVKNSSLNYAGYSYLLGDAALFAHGMLNKEPSRAMTGLFWGIGGLGASIYGTKPQEHQLKLLSYKMADYLKEQGIPIPKASELSTQYLSKRGGLIDNLQNFLYDHPSQILNATYAIGSLGLVKSGLGGNLNKEGKLIRDYWEGASGILVGTGALAGLFLPENSETQHSDKEPATLANPIEWLKEKPLRIPSVLYTLNNATLLKSGWDEHVANPSNKTYYLKFLTVASYVIANGLLGLSSKDADAQSKTSIPIEALEAMAAQIIANQPKEVQNHLLQQVSYHLASYKGIDLPPEEIALAMKDKITEHTTAQHHVDEKEWHGTLETSPAQVRT